MAHKIVDITLNTTIKEEYPFMIIVLYIAAVELVIIMTQIISSILQMEQ